MNEASGDQPDGQLQFIQELLDGKVPIAGDVVEITADTWAIHGVIPVDGGVIVAEFATYEEARVVLDRLPAGPPSGDRGWPGTVGRA